MFKKESIILAEFTIGLQHVLGDDRRNLSLRKLVGAKESGGIDMILYGNLIGSQAALSPFAAGLCVADEMMVEGRKDPGFLWPITSRRGR